MSDSNNSTPENFSAEKKKNVGRGVFLLFLSSPFWLLTALLLCANELNFAAKFMGVLILGSPALAVTSWAITKFTGRPLLHKMPRKRFEQTLSTAEAGSKQGDAIEQYNLGSVYLNGRGVTKDAVVAFKLFHRAAKQGHKEAQYKIGMMYDEGCGVTQDDAKAFKWYRDAAKQGHAGAQCCFGAMYANGRGVAKNDAKAVEWFKKAAEQGDANAQCKLGVRYANGRGVDKDETKAVEWFQKAAANGHPSAQLNLGNRYANGRGIEKDESKAVEWYRKAAVQGDDDAMYNLGDCCAKGRGVPKDETEAIKWWQKAANLGNADAIAKLQGPEQKEQRNSRLSTEKRSATAEAQYKKILGLDGDVTPENLRERYRDLAAKYHPDKVNHLGEKLQRLADAEMKQINEAYEYFNRKNCC